MMNECFITITIVWLLLYKVPKDRPDDKEGLTTTTAAIQFHHLMSLQVCHCKKLLCSEVAACQCHHKRLRKTLFCGVMGHVLDNGG